MEPTLPLRYLRGEQTSKAAHSAIAYALKAYQARTTLWSEHRVPRLEDISVHAAVQSQHGAYAMFHACLLFASYFIYA